MLTIHDEGDGFDPAQLERERPHGHTGFGLPSIRKRLALYGGRGSGEGRFQAYSAGVDAEGGSGGYTWSIVSGALPAGLEANVSLKPTQFGLAMDERLCVESVERVLSRAREVGNGAGEIFVRGPDTCVGFFADPERTEPLTTLIMATLTGLALHAFIEGDETRARPSGRRVGLRQGGGGVHHPAHALVGCFSQAMR